MIINLHFKIFIFKTFNLPLISGLEIKFLFFRFNKLSHLINVSSKNDSMPFGFSFVKSSIEIFKSLNSEIEFTIESTKDFFQGYIFENYSSKKPLQL